MSSNPLRGMIGRMKRLWLQEEKEDELKIGVWIEDFQELLGSTSPSHHQQNHIWPCIALLCAFHLNKYCSATSDRTKLHSAEKWGSQPPRIDTSSGQTPCPLSNYTIVLLCYKKSISSQNSFSFHLFYHLHVKCEDRWAAQCTQWFSHHQSPIKPWIVYGVYYTILFTINSQWFLSRCVQSGVETPSAQSISFCNLLSTSLCWAKKYFTVSKNTYDMHILGSVL